MSNCNWDMCAIHRVCIMTDNIQKQNEDIVRCIHIWYMSPFLSCFHAPIQFINVSLWMLFQVPRPVSLSPIHPKCLFCRLTFSIPIQPPESFNYIHVGTLWGGKKPSLWVFHQPLQIAVIAVYGSWFVVLVNTAMGLSWSKPLLQVLVW